MNLEESYLKKLIFKIRHFCVFNSSFNVQIKNLSNFLSFFCVFSLTSRFLNGNQNLMV